MGIPATYKDIIKNEILQDENPQTIERTIRKMVEEGILISDKKGNFWVNMGRERMTGLNEFMSKEV